MIINELLMFVEGMEESKDDLIVELPHGDFSKRPTSPAILPDHIQKQGEIFHSNPSIWWLGQFVRFLWKPNEEIRKDLENIKVQHPVVGLVNLILFKNIISKTYI